MDLSRARIRPARTPEEAARAADFLKSPSARDIALAHPEERGAVRLCEIDGQLVAALVLDPRPLPLRGVAGPCLRILETNGEDGRRHFRRTGERDLFQLLLEETLGYAWVRRYPLVFVHGELALAESRARSRSQRAARSRSTSCAIAIRRSACPTARRLPNI